MWQDPWEWLAGGATGSQVGFDMVFACGRDAAAHVARLRLAHRWRASSTGHTITNSRLDQRLYPWYHDQKMDAEGGTRRSDDDT